MNAVLTNLGAIADKQTKKIIGLMSGTSLDGLDIALCEISGSGDDTAVTLLEFKTHHYRQTLKQRLDKISSRSMVSLEEVCLIHTRLAEIHGDMVLEALETWGLAPKEIDAIASHGQTIYHAPKIQHKQDDISNTTLQIGDGDHLAVRTGILTISDFRQKHTAAGGEGAPMVSLVDSLLYTHPTENRILLNIGGIANYTWLPAKNSRENYLTTDTGPGNTLMDAAAKAFFSKDYDKDSKIARKGSVNHTLLDLLKNHDYFRKPIPKTTGPEVFNLDRVKRLAQENRLSLPEPVDLMATLTRFSAETIADSISTAVGENEAVIYASGGGIHNPLLMEWIRDLLPGLRVYNFREIGFEPDAKEAVLFAVLANELLSGEGFKIDPGSKTANNINFGKISFPR